MNALDHLLARSAGAVNPASAVRPRLPGRFEPVAGPPLDDGEWGETTEERRTDAPAPTREPRPTRDAARARLTVTRELRTVERETVTPTASQAPEPAAGPNEPDALPGEPTRPSLGPSEPADRSSTRLPDPPTLDASEEPTLAPAAPSGPAPSDASSRTPSTRTQPSPEPSRTAPSLGSPTETPPAPTLAVPPRLTAPTPEPARAAEPPRPRVDIRIGRIDVRPAGRADASPNHTVSPPRARRPRATVSLEDYLRRRGS